MHDEYLHGQESISGGSLESELAKSPSPVPVDFPIKQHISSNQKKKELEKALLTAEEQKEWTENKACLKDVCGLSLGRMRKILNLHSKNIQKHTEDHMKCWKSSSKAKDVEWSFTNQ